MWVLALLIQNESRMFDFAAPHPVEMELSFPHLYHKCVLCSYVLSPFPFPEWVSKLRILNVCFIYNEEDTRALIVKLASVL